MSGCTRYKTAEQAAKAVGDADPPATLDVKGQVADLLILEGDEELAFYTRVRLHCFIIPLSFPGSSLWLVSGHRPMYIVVVCTVNSVLFWQ
jgi:hypothetical protein